ncbi:HPP family-domain-containing protein [Boeremia exigua]|uniref:HPP family-domain-containing protein n=1 Tax=Boeremia exigua TaxID=749465 RepID=UPI001E8D835F|nr:HPP family-domain-containing protein [Boeremia exigua]KAH6622119.1 HPP family-domain-containing protein [Boeremia exigua]
MAAALCNNAESWHLDIDRYLNRVIPASPLHKLPTPVSRFLGYRKVDEQDVGNILGAFWSLVGAFCGLAVVIGVFNNTESIQQHAPPAMIASFGASAILEYNAVRSPLGQPRNALLGHTFSAIIGVSVSKLFQYHSEYEKIKWIAGAIGCACASAVMLLTGTVHPPGGASAVLAATEPAITAMGWYFVGLVAWGATLMVLIGLVINNIQRQFPVYWWTPLDLKRARKQDIETLPNARGGLERRKSEKEQRYDQPFGKIEITGAGVTLPEALSLNKDEAELLERLRVRLSGKVDTERGTKDLDEMEPSSGKSKVVLRFTVVGYD